MNYSVEPLVRQKNDMAQTIIIGNPKDVFEEIQWINTENGPADVEFAFSVKLAGCSN